MVELVSVEKTFIPYSCKYIQEGPNGETIKLLLVDIIDFRKLKSNKLYMGHSVEDSQCKILH